MISATNFKYSVCLALLALVGLVAASSFPEPNNPSLAKVDSPALKIISDEDQASMQTIKHHIDNNFSELKTFSDVHSFLDKVKLLVQKHPKNVAFAQGDLKDLHKFLTQDMITRLIRVDTEPFVGSPLDDKKIRDAIDDDDLTAKLFGTAYTTYDDAKRQQASRNVEGTQKSDNIFQTFWCRISGSCSV